MDTPRVIGKREVILLDHYRIDIYSEEGKELFWSLVDKSGGPDSCWVWMGPFRANGYGEVLSLCSKKYIPAHRASMIITHGSISPKMIILHSCHNRLCVNPSHLREGTHKENMEDMVSSGRSARGEKHGAFVTTNEQVCEIRKRRAAGEFITDIARNLNIKSSTAYKIALGYSMIHEPGERTRFGRGIKGERNPGTTLKREDVIRIRGMAREGLSNRVIGELYGVTVSSASAIVLGRTWKDDGEPLSVKERDSIRGGRFIGTVPIGTAQSIRHMRALGIPVKKIIERFGFKRTTIYKIAYGKHKKGAV